ncbi:four helix bundle protein [Nonlabens agnitus]|uniref:Four helix bundle protein n=1 Tax=Nonlabens agnitus TaxID=870484 RepID=A0A2S9WW51_9FLAO|nr:four helix bundle protein [Nonlabens agnitus]PRP67693.1 four helix bundle protein [Nonlabens agnitus]
MRNFNSNPIVNMTFNFSLDIIEFVQKLKAQKDWDLASQLFRSGTSIGANVWEAQNAESPKDFIHKFKISAKESDETEYWMEICKASKHLPTPDEKLFKDRDSISKVLSKIIGTTKRNMNNG